MFTRILPLVALLAAPLAAVAAPVEFEDALGRTIRLEGPANRLAMTNHYEDMFAVAGPSGIGKLAGFSKKRWFEWRNSKWQAYEKVAPSITTIPDIGMIWDDSFSVEKVASLNPDLIVLPKEEFLAMTTQVEQLEGLGMQVMVVDFMAQTPAGHRASLSALGRALGETARADELLKLYESSVARIDERLAKTGDDRPKMYFEIGNKGPKEHSLTWNTALWGPIMRAAGADNIATGKVEAWGNLNPEYVIASAPDVIFLAGSYWPQESDQVRMGFGIDRTETSRQIAGYATRPGWASLPAVKNGRMYGLYHELAFGVFSFAAMEFIAKALYPDFFADVDPEGALRDYYANYLPVAAEGSFMVGPVGR